MIKTVSVNFQQQIYNQSGSVDSNCAAMTFINIGTEPVTVLGYTLLINQSFTPAMNLGEWDTTNYTIKFGLGGGTTQLLVIRKYYN